MENNDQSEPTKMNNNPISLLFNLGETAVDVLKEYKNRGLLLSDEETLNNRMVICLDCKSFNKESARCNLCGCFMKIKVRLESAKCPIGKW